MFGHCSSSNRLAVVHRTLACAESPAPVELALQQLFQQILDVHGLVFAAAAAPVVALEAAAFLADMEQLDHVVWCRLVARSVSMDVALELAAAVEQEKMLATMASAEVGAADIAAFSEQPQRFAPEDWSEWQCQQFLQPHSVAQYHPLAVLQDLR